MRILDDATDTTRDSMTLLVTRDEAQQLREQLDALLGSPDVEHVHVASGDAQKEVVIALYDVQRLDDFTDRFRRLILTDQ